MDTAGEESRAVERAVRLLRADAAASGMDLELEVLPEAELEHAWRVNVSISREGVGSFMWTTDEDPDDTLASLANEVQELMIYWVHGAWPECSHHGVPMWLAWTRPPTWQCERNPSDVAQVGRLSSQSEPILE